MAELAAAVNNPVLWLRSELTDDLVGKTSTPQLSAYWAWCRANVTGSTASSAAREQADRIRKREDASRHRIFYKHKKAMSELADLRAQNEQLRAQNEQLRQQNSAMRFAYSMHTVVPVGSLEAHDLAFMDTGDKCALN